MSSLLKTLFPEKNCKEWETNINNQDYITKLGTYKLKNFKNEPERLKQEYAVVQDQIQELAVTNYKTFIETALCSKELFFKFGVIEEKVNDLLEDIPNYENTCDNFASASGEINVLRKTDSTTLAKSAQILEILEIPQLMNSFIRDGLYEDALELCNYVRKLHSKHSDVPLFKTINDDVNKAWILMLHQLLCQLRQDLSLPKCLQTVGHLRRMEIFSEPELRLKFLQARSHWLDQQLSSLSKEDTISHLSKTIEITRVNLFNILTQYTAIFNDDEHSPLSISHSKTINQNIIFKSWFRNQLSNFLDTLDQDLNGSVSLESVFDQCMYFGFSFSKVGCDFRPLLLPIFIKHIFQNFANIILTADTNFIKNIEKFTLIDKKTPSILWKHNKGDDIRPPDNLLEFYPLAEYLNNVLTGLNQLRICPPISLIVEVVEIIESSLTLIAKSLHKLYSQEQQAFSVNSKDAFTRLCMCFSDDLLPFVQKCIHVIYPPSNIVTKLGVSVKVLQEESISFLNKETIIAPIKHLLPIRVEPDLKVDTDTSNE